MEAKFPTYYQDSFAGKVSRLLLRLRGRRETKMREATLLMTGVALVEDLGGNMHRQISAEFQTKDGPVRLSFKPSEAEDLAEGLVGSLNYLRYGIAGGGIVFGTPDQGDTSV